MKPPLHAAPNRPLFPNARVTFRNTAQGGRADTAGRYAVGAMKIVRKLRAWWRGTSDPTELAEAQRIREDVETLRQGSLTGSPNVTHRGKDSTRGF